MPPPDMPDPKDNDSFLRKVVRFVANPTTDWADLTQRTEDVRETEYAKSELKAMIERKRRNDFVRKREFDMLRKVRREGLSSEQLAALGGSSRIDDSERLNDSGAKADSGVKAKIDEIEQQMVGDNNYATTGRRPPPFYEAMTQPAPVDGQPPPPPPPPPKPPHPPPAPGPRPPPPGGARGAGASRRSGAGSRAGGRDIATHCAGGAPGRPSADAERPHAVRCARADLGRA